MTKIDSPQNTPELMDVSVIDINTWEQAGSPAADKTQSAPTVSEGLFLSSYLMYDSCLHVLLSGEVKKEGF